MVVLDKEKYFKLHLNQNMTLITKNPTEVISMKGVVFIRTQAYIAKLTSDGAVLVAEVFGKVSAVADCPRFIQKLAGVKTPILPS